MTDSYQELYLGEESGSYHLTITAFENIFFSVLGVLIGVLCGWLLYRMVRAFLPVRPHWGTPLLAVTIGISAVMVIWVGDPNLLYTLPFYVAGFMLSTRGDRVGRITLCFIFFCMSMSIAALLDTYIGYGFLNRNTDLATRCGRLIITLAIYLGFHRFLPKEPPLLSRNLWMLTLALSLLPMAALCSTVLLTYPRWESEAVLNVSLRVGMGILPFVLITSIVLLAAIIVLARQNAMEQEQALAAQRAFYYEGLQQQDQQLRQLRHDLRNHITAAAGLLELGKVEEARAYLDELGESRALSRPRRFCENETVNIVLAAKADALAQSGIAADFQVALPADLAIADTDLCALLGNALDNALLPALLICECVCIRDIIFASTNEGGGSHVGIPCTSARMDRRPRQLENHRPGAGHRCGGRFLWRQSLPGMARRGRRTDAGEGRSCRQRGSCCERVGGNARQRRSGGACCWRCFRAWRLHFTD